MIKKIAILTSGGDAPGMNNAVIAVAKSAISEGIVPFVVYEGYKGLYEDNMKEVSIYDMERYQNQGGTFIYSARFPEFKELSYREKARDNLNKRGIDALVVIGGDGSYKGAQLLHELGIKTMALPGTIDNDISSSDYTIGFQTALQTIVDNVEKVRDTMESHDRCAIVEVMGRFCGDLALEAAIATGAEVLVTPNHKLEPEVIGQIVKKVSDQGKRGVIVIASENIYDDVDEVAKVIENVSHKVTRAVTLGHLQRGGNPVAGEKVLATKMGMKAVEFLKEGKTGLAIGIIKNEIVGSPIEAALNMESQDTKDVVLQINKLNQA